MAVHTACNAVVILKIEARPGCTITKGCCSSARETNKNKKVTFKLQQGLNFTVDVEFGFAKMNSVKQPEGKKIAYCVVFYDVKTVIFVRVQIEKMKICKKADFFVFIGYSNLRVGGAP